MKKIVFLTGTRADFGKLKSLIQAVHQSADFEYHIFATGMHLQEKYGLTVIEIEKAGFKNIHQFKNHTAETSMELTLAKTIEGFSAFIKEIAPDLIIVHGDRVESLAGAITGSLNNILVGHVEGGEISGTVDELIRHSVSKLSHIHFVSNQLAARRLIQMGEMEASIFVVGSPDLDILFSHNLPTLKEVKTYYEIPFETYAILLFHPITTAVIQLKDQALNLTQALLEDTTNYVVIYPNNDLGSSYIFEAYESLKTNARFRMFPSIRFEYFITLLNNAEFLLGNSSAGIHEAPYLGIPTVNVGQRQENRDLKNIEIVHTSNEKEAILEGIEKAKMLTISVRKPEIKTAAAEQFIQALHSHELWEINHQKQFKDI